MCTPPATLQNLHTKRFTRMRGASFKSPPLLVLELEAPHIFANGHALLPYLHTINHNGHAKQRHRQRHKRHGTRHHSKRRQRNRNQKTTKGTRAKRAANRKPPACPHATAQHSLAPSSRHISLICSSPGKNNHALRVESPLCNSPRGPSRRDHTELLRLKEQRYPSTHFPAASIAS